MPNNRHKFNWFIWCCTRMINWYGKFVWLAVIPALSLSYLQAKNVFCIKLSDFTQFQLQTVFFLNLIILQSRHLYDNKEDRRAKKYWHNWSQNKLIDTNNFKQAKTLCGNVRIQKGKLVRAAFQWKLYQWLDANWKALTRLCIQQIFRAYFKCDKEINGNKYQKAVP